MILSCISLGISLACLISGDTPSVKDIFPDMPKKKKRYKATVPRNDSEDIDEWIKR